MAEPGKWTPLGSTGLEAREELLEDPRYREQVADILDRRLFEETFGPPVPFIADYSRRARFLRWLSRPIWWL